MFFPTTASVVHCDVAQSSIPETAEASLRGSDIVVLVSECYVSKLSLIELFFP